MVHYLRKNLAQYEFLLAMFPGGPEQDPLKIRLNLRALELKALYIAKEFYRGEATSEEVDATIEKIKSEARKWLPGIPTEPENSFGFYLSVTSDIHDYLLKLVPNNASERLPANFPIQMDWRGYGILAPDRD